MLALCNLTGSEQHRDVAVSAGGAAAVAALATVLQQGPDDAKQSVATALGNPTGSEQPRDVALSTGGVAVLVRVLQQGPDDAKQDAAGALCKL